MHKLNKILILSLSMVLAFSSFGCSNTSSNKIEATKENNFIRKAYDDTQDISEYYKDYFKEINEIYKDGYRVEQHVERGKSYRDIKIDNQNDKILITANSCFYFEPHGNNDENAIYDENEKMDIIHYLLVDDNDLYLQVINDDINSCRHSSFSKEEKDEYIETFNAMLSEYIVNPTPLSNVSFDKYIDSVNLDGITYDIINVKKNIDDDMSEYHYYINRKTQEIYKISQNESEEFISRIDNIDTSMISINDCHESDKDYFEEISLSTFYFETNTSEDNCCSSETKISSCSSCSNGESNDSCGNCNTNGENSSCTNCTNEDGTCGMCANGVDLETFLDSECCTLKCFIDNDFTFVDLQLNDNIVVITTQNNETRQKANLVFNEDAYNIIKENEITKDNLNEKIDLLKTLKPIDLEILNYK